MAIEAAEQSVAVARQLAMQSATLDNQRRLARALWRQTHAYFMAGDFPTAAQCARRCWAVCRQLLEATAADAAAFDEVVGLVTRWCGMLGPAVAMVGPQPEADAMEAACREIAARAAGPRGRQARALNAMADLFAKADTFRQADLDGHREQITGELHEAVAQARHGVDVLRGHTAEGPSETIDLARMLQVLSRLYVVDGSLTAAEAALDEAISIAESVADTGPTFAELLRQIRVERHGRPGTTPVVRSQAGPHMAPSMQAFLRAARDLNEDGSGRFPGNLAGAAAVIERARLQEAEDPGRYGPVRGSSRHGAAGFSPMPGSSTPPATQHRRPSGC
jgi:hypothetical protein